MILAQRAGRLTFMSTSTLKNATLYQLGRFAVGMNLLPDPNPPEVGAIPLDPQVQAKRQAVWAQSRAVGIYGGGIVDVVLRIAAVPGAFLDDAELNQLIAEDDELHDGFYRAVYGQTESYRQVPATPELQTAKAAAGRIQQHFTPDTAITRASFGRQAASAREKLALLDTHRADFDAIPVADGTLYSWMKRGLEAAIRLESRLELRDQGRAGAADRTGIVALRIELISKLTRLRTALADEAGQGGVPADAVALVFGPLEQALDR